MEIGMNFETNFVMLSSLFLKKQPFIEKFLNLNKKRRRH
jgi:hypothetical protein